MRLSLALAALVAVVPALANAIPPQARSGTIIPLSKRAVQTKDNKGVVNRSVLKSLTTGTLRNLRRDLAAHKRSAGEPSATRLSRDAFERGGRSGGAPLIDDSNLFWYAPISVGTPPTSFIVNIDSVRSSFFLPGTSCGSTCQGHNIYDTAASSTARDLHLPFTLDFGDGPLVQGEIFSDTVTMAGLNVANQSIGVASRYAGDLSLDQFPPDGIMGFGFSEISETGNTFLDNLVEQGVVDVPQVSIKLTADDGQIFLGGVNSDLFSGEFTTLNVTQHGLWQVTVDTVNVGDHEAVGVVQALIYIGTPLTFGPTQDVVQFYQSIPGSKDATDIFEAGFFTVPCDIDPQVSFTLGGRQFEMPVDSFNLGKLTEGSTDCIGGVVARDADTWTLGDNFLRNYYTNFDYGAKQVGIAALA